MTAHAFVAREALGSQRDHGGTAAMQPPIALCGWLGRCPTTRKATDAAALMFSGNSLLHHHIRESLTTFSSILTFKRPPAGVHVVRNLSGQRICAHLGLFTDLGERGAMITGAI